MPLPYSIREGLAGFRRARFAAVASTSAMMVALVLVGLFGAVGYQAQQVSQWLQQRVGEMELFLVEDVEEGVAQRLVVRAEATAGVASVNYVTREEAQAIFERDFGEGAEDFFDSPFLSPSIRVQVEPGYANVDSMSGLQEEFASWNRVEEVIYNQDLLLRVQENLPVLTAASLVFGLIILLAAVFLVANTIRLTIYARRLLIRTMKLVGATDRFIRRPFVVEGVLQGLLAGLLAGLLLWGFHRLLLRFVEALMLPQGLLWSLIAGLVVLGVVLGWLASYTAVRRFVRKVPLH